MTNETTPDTVTGGEAKTKGLSEATWAVVLAKPLAYGMTFTIINLVLRNGFRVPFILSMTASCTLAMIFAYWVPPKPRVSFLSYSAAMVLAGVSLFFAFALPWELRQFMPIQLAAALPVTVLSLPVRYALLKLIPEARRVSLTKWLLASFIFAVLLSCEAAFLFEAR